MRRSGSDGHEVGIDLLLAGSDAFRYLADELAAEYARRYEAGAHPESLEWARRMAEFSGWWCGRLEAEADYMAGFDPRDDVDLNNDTPAPTDMRFETRREGRQRACRRRREPPR